MARKPTPPQPTRAQLDQAQLKTGVARFKRLIADIEAFDPSSVNQRHDPQVDAIDKRIEEALEKTFGSHSTQYDRYNYLAKISPQGMIMVSDFGPRPSLADYVSDLKESRTAGLTILREVLRSLEEDLEEHGEIISTADLVVRKSPSNKVFIVHGHDNEAKQTVARFIEKTGYTPIILHEQVSGGRTIIEKIEANSEVDFAVVLLTPDDIGGPRGGAEQPRARQNVIFELGYFIALLKRSNVFALKRGDLEVPSDFVGVIYHDMDSAGAWQQDLAREMEGAGLSIDWNKVMKGNS